VTLVTNTKQTEAKMGAVIEATGPNGTVPLNPRRFVLVLVLERCDDSWVGGSKLVEPGERWARGPAQRFRGRGRRRVRDFTAGGARWKTMGVLF
jgi:hypothetical protein